ncbi:FAD-binding oxidoreductase [Marinoscillum furvescens]|uniref:FAD/FMN-containing dehydrogenase n=1 Tax=Marinoscillum furvescens DSM 4134 TaxID=1122208 RepID=A0A3D9L0V5_MARFU|nr:FAD-binding oxidoreductase [Marinoscillum furvescens]RED97074.1 FAD/FMN-containing dehydrogenase [Marinoscillum furvescens DSM 4134]
MAKVQSVKNWNNFPEVESTVYSFRTSGELQKLLRESPKVIARGAGLSYGDASLGEHVLSTHYFNKILSFDPYTGVLRAESGVTLRDILEVIVPKGWFLPVTPGTKNVTLGGAVAADVHGKNHHAEGSIANFIRRIRLMTGDGVLMHCSATESRDVFMHTCGGMGLTGVILDVTLQLKKIETSYINQRNIVAPNLKRLLELLRANGDATYSVAWIDCLARGKHRGRGVVMLGEHSTRRDLAEKHQKEPLTVHQAAGWKIPFHFPHFALSRPAVQLFNAYFYAKYRWSKKDFQVHYDTFFYPLDGIKDWNRMYGRKGFLQYQFVLPFDGGEQALDAVLERICKHGAASFLAVLKLMGPESSPVSFPMPGYTLALDIPMSSRLFALLDELDELVVAHGGRIYLAKDARSKRHVLQQGYPRIDKFRSIRKLTGAFKKFESLLSRRLEL